MFEAEDIDIDRFYYNPLYRDYIFNFSRLKKYFQYDYRKIESYRKRKVDIAGSYKDSKRNRVASALKKYNLKLKCSKKTVENIDRLEDNNTLVIIGGQQPGLLTGPIFIIYKILTIIRLSKFFEEDLKVPVIPLFWNASDDNNLKAVGDLKLIGNRITNIKLDLSGVREKTRFSNIYLEAERFIRLAEDIDRSLDPSTHKPGIMDFIKSCLDITLKNFSDREGRVNISSFFSVIISRMFSEYGLVVIDPADKGLKELSLELLEYNIRHYRETTGLITDAGRRLEKDGYHAQLNPVPGALDFFWDDGGVRKKIFSGENDSFLIGGAGIEGNALIRKIKKDIANVSLNVVLRPLFEDSILPVLCIVCGPGEVSYFSQLKTVYDDAGLKLPIIYPRLSATIIDKNIAMIMEKEGLAWEDLEPGKELALRNIISKRMGIDLETSMQGLEDNIFLDLKEMEERIFGDRMNISNSFDRIKRNIKKEIKVLSKKLNSEFKRQDDHLENRLDKLFMNIFPGGNLQEREASMINYLNKYGFKFLDFIYSGTRPLDFLHKFFKAN